MKVACYIGSLGTGGIESSTVSQFLRINDPEVSFVFLVDRKSSVTNQYYKKIIEEHHGKICWLEDDSNINIKKVSKRKKIKAISNFIRSESIDVFHIHASYPSNLFYSLIVKTVSDAKVYATIHARGIANPSILSALIQTFCRKFFPLLINKRLAVSKDAGRWGYGCYKFDVLPNGVDLDKFKFSSSHRTEIRDQLGITDEAMVIGIVGRLEVDKNHVFAIRLFSELHKKDPNSLLLIIGNGSLRCELSDLTKELGLEHNVKFINHVNNPEFYMSCMDLLLFPSLREGFGLVAVEAQANGLPVVASDSVPQETNVSNTIKYLSLQAPMSIWIQNVLDLVAKGKQRTVEQIRLKKYSISEIAINLVNYYKNGII